MKTLTAVIAGLSLASTVSGAAWSAGEPTPYTVVDGGIPKALTQQAGDPGVGRDAMIDRKLGNCLACHVVSDMSDHPFHGQVGPALDGAGSRWSEAELRLIVVNSKEMFPDTIMPGFHATKNLNRVAGDFKGKTILSAQQVEDVVAYLKTLTE